MSCQKYSGWLTDAALGELRADCELELLVHAAECDACREALNHAREVHQFIDRGVESLVAGEPSPNFATNLRRRIAQESEPQQPPWMAWAPVAAGALVLALVLAITVAHLQVHSEVNPSVASAMAPVSVPSEAAKASTASPQIVKRTESKHDPAPGVRARRHHSPSGNHRAEGTTLCSSATERGNCHGSSGWQSASGRGARVWQASGSEAHRNCANGNSCAGYCHGKTRKLDSILNESRLTGVFIYGKPQQMNHRRLLMKISRSLVTCALLFMCAPLLVYGQGTMGPDAPENAAVGAVNASKVADRSVRI